MHWIYCSLALIHSYLITKTNNCFVFAWMTAILTPWADVGPCLKIENLHEYLSFSSPTATTKWLKICQFFWSQNPSGINKTSSLNSRSTQTGIHKRYSTLMWIWSTVYRSSHVHLCSHFLHCLLRIPPFDWLDDPKAEHVIHHRVTILIIHHKTFM